MSMLAGEEKTEVDTLNTFNAFNSDTYVNS